MGLGIKYGIFIKSKPKNLMEYLHRFYQTLVLPPPYFITIRIEVKLTLFLEGGNMISRRYLSLFMLLAILAGGSFVNAKTKKQSKNETTAQQKKKPKSTKITLTEEELQERIDKALKEHDKKKKAAKEAKKAEAARLAAEKAKEVEEARIAAEEAKEAEKTRLAAEEAKRQEDAKLEEGRLDAENAKRLNLDINSYKKLKEDAKTLQIDIDFLQKYNSGSIFNLPDAPTDIKDRIVAFYSSMSEATVRIYIHFRGEGYDIHKCFAGLSKDESYFVWTSSQQVEIGKNKIKGGPAFNHRTDMRGGIVFFNTYYLKTRTPFLELVKHENNAIYKLPSDKFKDIDRGLVSFVEENDVLKIYLYRDGVITELYKLVITELPKR